MSKKTTKDGGANQAPAVKEMPTKINPEIKAILERVMERAGEEDGGTECDKTGGEPHEDSGENRAVRAKTSGEVTAEKGEEHAR